MSVLADIVNAVVGFQDTVSTFLNLDLYTLLTKFVAWFIQWSMVVIWKAKLALLIFSWSVAQEIMANLHISDLLSTAWGGLDSQVSGFLAFFRIPEAFNMIISASITKFVFKLLG
jgi:hypothetical protein